MRVLMVRMGATAALALKRTEALLMMMKQYALPEAASLLEIITMFFILWTSSDVGWSWDLMSCHCSYLLLYLLTYLNYSCVLSLVCGM